VSITVGQAHLKSVLKTTIGRWSVTDIVQNVNDCWLDLDVVSLSACDFFSFKVESVRECPLRKTGCSTHNSQVFEKFSLDLHEVTLMSVVVIDDTLQSACIEPSFLAVQSCLSRLLNE
jgi:hypothetical protein